MRALFGSVHFSLHSLLCARLKRTRISLRNTCLEHVSRANHLKIKGHNWMHSTISYIKHIFCISKGITNSTTQWVLVEMTTHCTCLRTRICQRSSLSQYHLLLLGNQYTNINIKHCRLAHPPSMELNNWVQDLTRKWDKQNKCENWRPHFTSDWAE